MRKIEFIILAVAMAESIWAELPISPSALSRGREPRLWREIRAATR
ncbi:MAG TPA: hypothetical protein VEI46_02490 [Thermodesulfovibrionales bacterium]|nr:hypothetical protein [Thermodesulfovibrionales bacterium]